MAVNLTNQTVALSGYAAAGDGSIYGLTPPGNNEPTGLPTISGTEQVGQTLSAVTGNIADADGLGGFTYQWDADGDDISGATSSTYVLTSSEESEVIKVSVEYTDGKGNVQNITSAPTNTISPSGVIFQLSDPSYSVSETGGTVTITTDRIGDTTGTATVYLATKRLLGSAYDTADLHLVGYAEDQDFNSPGNYDGFYTQLTFADSESTKDQDITIYDWDGYTGDLIFGVYLLDANDGAEIHIDSQYESHKIVTITDTDVSGSVGTLGLSSATYSVSEAGGSVVIQADRTVGSDDAISIDYATSDGTATAGSDYTDTSGTLNWADGDSSAKTFIIPILNNAGTEGSETVTITLSNEANSDNPGSPPSTDTLVATLTITEPGVGDIVDEDFEGGSIASPFQDQSSSGTQPGASGPCTITVNTTKPYAGSYSCEAFYAGSSDQRADGRPQLGFNLSGQYPELWVSFRRHLPSNHYHRTPTVGTANNKWLMMSNYSGDLFCDFEDTPYGGSGDAKLSMQWKKNNVNQGWLDSNRADGGNFGNWVWARSATRNTWVEYVFHYRLSSSPSASDGRIEAWENGVKVFDAQNVDHYTTSGNYFERGYFFGAANSGYDDDTYMYIDDILFSTESLEP